MGGGTNGPVYAVAGYGRTICIFLKFHSFFNSLFFYNYVFIFMYVLTM